MMDKPCKTIPREARNEWLLVSILWMLSLVGMAYIYFNFAWFPLNYVASAIMLALTVPTVLMIYGLMTVEVTDAPS